MSLADVVAHDKATGVLDSKELEGLCEGCWIAAVVEPGDKYCPDCTNDIVEYLARN